MKTDRPANDSRSSSSSSGRSSSFALIERLVPSSAVEVALRLPTPMNGAAPELWPLGYKSAGRRLFSRARLPVPFGRQDVHDERDRRCGGFTG